MITVSRGGISYIIKESQKEAYASKGFFEEKKPENKPESKPKTKTQTKK